jgi:hypothetical protein
MVLVYTGIYEVVNILLLLLLLVLLLLLLPLVLFERLELLEICARICRLSCICCRSNLSIRVRKLSVVADDCAVALLLAVRTGARLCWAVLPVLVGGLLAAAVAWPLCPGLVCFSVCIR